jgi:hypothetical protein
MPDKIKVTKARSNPKNVPTRPPDDIETLKTASPDVQTKTPDDVETTTKA